jgi:hypothetical protein
VAGTLRVMVQSESSEGIKDADSRHHGRRLRARERKD